MSRRQVPPLEPPSPSTVLLSSSLSTTLMNLHRNRSSLSTSRALSRAGYYMNRDVFVAQGDFITSPEMSQMISEVQSSLAGGSKMEG
ncbi:unnamed protein product [Microthlaspi erraticum]|uniref:Uncharacterized protein n=1 Tax=Microthlaspi erraticum TaxID=1685480 RepID=A0A6D2IHE1_9BRAS|nr:unnamed protein product [Microthlaspi erraticum]